MNRLARFVILFAVLALASACGARQFATGYPKDELVLSRLGNTVAVLYNGEMVQRIEVRGDFRYDGLLPVKASTGTGSTARFLSPGPTLGVTAGNVSRPESICATTGVVYCAEVDYLGVMLPYAVSFYGDRAEVDIAIIQADKHLVWILYQESVTTPEVDSPGFEEFCTGVLARALGTFKVDVPALRIQMAPAKPTV